MIYMKYKCILTVIIPNDKRELFESAIESQNEIIEDMWIWHNRKSVLTAGHVYDIHVQGDDRTDVFGFIEVCEEYFLENGIEI